MNQWEIVAKPLEKMTDYELRNVALEKKKNGCATSEALKAQKILFDNNINRIEDCVDEVRSSDYDSDKDYN